MCQKGCEFTIVYTALCWGFLVENLIEVLLQFIFKPQGFFNY